MPILNTPDGARLNWHEEGEGPLVVLANQFFSSREVFAGLLADLATDHRVITYDLRGTGGSSREGPYDLATDTQDLRALIEDQGERALVVAFADGCNRAVKLAAERPDLISFMVTPGGNPVGRRAARGTDALAASDSVMDALMGMMRTDYRGAVNTMISTANPAMGPDDVSHRVSATVEHCSQEVAVLRMAEWIEGDLLEEARALGDRMWLLEHGTSAWFTLETAQRTRELLPAAHIVDVEDGPVSRPDIAAGVVRRLTRGPVVVASRERSEGREPADQAL